MTFEDVKAMCFIAEIVISTGYFLMAFLGDDKHSARRIGFATFFLVAATTTK